MKTFSDNDILKFFQGLQPKKKRTKLDIFKDYEAGKINVREFFKQMDEVTKNGK